MERGTGRRATGSSRFGLCSKLSFVTHSSAQGRKVLGVLFCTHGVVGFRRLNRVSLRLALLGLVVLQLASADALREGLAALAEKRFADARAPLEAAAQEGRPLAWVALARTYRELGLGAEQVEALQRAEELGLESGDAQVGLVIYYAELEEWGSAAVWQERFARGQPGDVEATLQAIQLHLRAGDAEAAGAFAIDTPARGLSAEIEKQAALAHSAAGARKEADAAFRAAIALSPYEEGLRWDHVYFFLQAQEFSEALDAVAEGRKVFDKSPRLELGRGIALYGLRRFDEAFDALLRACKLAPSVPQPHAFLGRLLQHAGGRIDEVVERYEVFSSANPKSALGPFLTASALMVAMGARLDERADRAESLLEESIARNGEYWESRLAYGKLLAMRRDIEGAAAQLEKAVALTPDAAEAHYHLARAYARLDRREDAARERALHAEITERQRQAMSAGGMETGANAGLLLRDPPVQ